MSVKRNGITKLTPAKVSSAITYYEDTLYSLYLDYKQKMMEIKPAQPVKVDSLKLESMHNY
jgi:hypothetical protein